MSNELYGEVHRQLQRLSRYLEKVTHVFRVITAFLLAVFILSMRGMLHVAGWAEPYMRKISRLTKAGVISAQRNALAAARKLRDTEKSFQPMAIGAVQKTREAVVDTTARAVPAAKKAAWSIGRMIFVSWMSLTVGAILVLLVLGGVTGK